MPVAAWWAGGASLAWVRDLPYQGCTNRGCTVGRVIRKVAGALQSLAWPHLAAPAVAADDASYLPCNGSTGACVPSDTDAGAAGSPAVGVAAGKVKPAVAGAAAAFRSMLAGTDTGVEGGKGL